MASIHQGPTMHLHAQAPQFTLAPGEVVTLQDARGARISARTGTVWVTEEADPKDHILGPGEAFVLARNGRTVIQALAPSWIAIDAANDAVDGTIA
jgi:hypothetical protein